MVNRTLDFNALTPPTLELTMMDDDHTVLAVTPPTEGEAERVAALGQELQKVYTAKDAATLQGVYTFIAELLSHNLNGITVTAEELRDKYRMRQWHLLAFMQQYVAFLGDIKDAKN